MNSLQRLDAWFAAQSNGDWEHLYCLYCISLEKLDNPGWWLKIELDGCKKPFENQQFRRGEITIEINMGILHASCNTLQLDEMLGMVMDILEKGAK